MALVGQGALILALLLAVWAVVAGLAAATGRDARLLRSAALALWGILALVAVAVAIFVHAIVTHDFSFSVVASSTSRSLPWGYLITSAWASQAGSLLLWASILIVFSLLALRATRQGLAEIRPWLIAILGAILAFFLLLLVVPASPFATQVAPPDGNGLNPALQNPYMATHPPALYLGYVGLAIPFALAMASMLAGRVDARWVVASRRWTLVAWASSGSGSCSARTGPTRRSAGAASGPGTPSRTPP